MNRWLVVLVACAGCAPDVVEPGCALLGARTFEQGELVATDSLTDLALHGEGFFILADEGRTAFTRDGHFTIDTQGLLRGPGAWRVQGFRPGASVTSDLRIGPSLLAPVPTSRVSIRANLDASAAVPASPFDPANPTTTAAFASTTTLWDVLGQPQVVDVYWQHTGPGTWDFHGMAQTGEEIATGELIFDPTGHLVSVTQYSHFFPPGATATQPLEFDFGATVADGASGLEGVTQFAGTGTTTFVGQDGFGTGVLVRAEIDQAGRIELFFDNSEARRIGQVAVARFADPQGLLVLREHLLLSTPLSGEAQVGSAGAQGRAVMLASTLEQQPVDACGR